MNEEAIEVELNIPEMEGTLTDLYSQTEYEVENETINFEIPSMQDGATAIFVLTAEEQEPPGTPGGEVPGGNGGDDKGEANDDLINPVVEQDKTVLFQYDGHLDAESVKVAGSFTDWQNSAIELQKEGEMLLICNIHQVRQVFLKGLC